jgi:hypothetical protein
VLGDDYPEIFQRRLDLLAEIRADPQLLSDLKTHYAANPADFIHDWGCTYDPRNLDIGLPATVPFLLFPRQREFVQWVMERWRAREPGVAPKSRDMGLSWLTMSLFVTLCIFHPQLALGVGSRKLELVDKLGDPKTLFWKARKFLELLPYEFAGDWSSKENLLTFANGSTIAGEGGDDIGRGGRTAIYLVDEAAFLARPETVDASLSQTTNCRIDVSTPNGSANPFAYKVTSWAPERVFRFHWRDDPRKDEAWYARQQESLDPVVLAQEVDMDFSASITGVLIPSAWVQSAIGLHLKLGMEVTGERRGALDVADEGRDLNAFASARGVLLDHVEEWSGKGGDIFATTARAFHLCDDLGITDFDYDSDGLGAGVRGDARILNETRRTPINATPFRGSGSVDRPEAQDVGGRLNKDFFLNLKAQRWWGLRRRFEQAHRAATGMDFDPEMLICIDPALPLLAKITAELSQPTYSINATGKIVVDKVPDGMRSPNLADAIMIRMGRTRRPIRISDELLRAI